MSTAPPARRTAGFDDPAQDRSRAPRRCKVTLVTGSGTESATDLAVILRPRLTLAALITVIGGGIFFLRTLFDPTFPVTSSYELSLHALVEITAVVAAGLLLSPLPLCVPRMRLIESVMFGTLVAFFAAGQFALFSSPFVTDLVHDSTRLPTLHLVAGAMSLRWFILMVIYATFIPNTWRMCALRVAVTLLVPLAVAVAAGIEAGTLDVLLTTAMLDMTVMLGIGSSVAVFGAYRIEALQHEAAAARQVGQYRLRRKLGTGGMGEVYLAEHVLLRRPSAIKIIRPDQMSDPTALSRFEREVQSTARLTHPNTVEIYDFGRTDDGTFYYVMEYLPGLSLQDLVERHGSLEAARAIHFLRQACGALREAHAGGLIHRDIKPSNILACERGGIPDVAKLVDFGLVQASGLPDSSTRLTLKGMVLGSPPYMAPEQAAGKMSDERSDIYSLGGVGHFLLTARPPFAKETALEMILAHAYEPVQPLTQLRPDVPADLEAVIVRCLEKDPARRFQNAGELERALASCASAGAWTEELAAAWWREREPAERTETPAPTPLPQPTAI